MWKYTGNKRPSFADPPGPGQESVWDYPRPPALLPYAALVQVACDQGLLAKSQRTLRVMETASPPTVYVPPADIQWNQLCPAPGSSFCEWKGAARYWALAQDDSLTPVAWSYPQPSGGFRDLAEHLAFYPGRVHCTVDGETVRPQPGGFYGGWLTDQIAGPVKGEPGTGHW